MNAARASSFGVVSGVMLMAGVAGVVDGVPLVAADFAGSWATGVVPNSTTIANDPKNVLLILLTFSNQKFKRSCA
jgi:hypothetical protein